MEGKQFKNVKASNARVQKDFDQELDAMTELPTLLGLFPQFKTIIAHAVVVRLGFQVGMVEKEMGEWNEEDAVKVGSSVSTFVRTTTTPSMAVGAWRSHF